MSMCGIAAGLESDAEATIFATVGRATLVHNRNLCPFLVTP